MDTFETYRPLMFSIAYRMLGSAMEAEDIVQEAYLRYQRVPPESIQSPKAFLSTVVTRLCLNQLQSAQAKRETYVGPWLPEPILTDENPSTQASIHESLSMAFLVLLENLTPVERAVFLLREVFGYEYAEIATILDKEEAACRQLLSRAKKYIAENRPRFQPSPEKHREILTRFLEAAGEGKLDSLMQLLTDDVTLWADGGGKARGAALHPLHGREAVVRFVLASPRWARYGFKTELAEVNGELAAIIRDGDKIVVVLFIETDQDRVRTIRVIGNPDKLTRV